MTISKLNLHVLSKLTFVDVENFCITLPSVVRKIDSLLSFLSFMLLTRVHFVYFSIEVLKCLCFLLITFIT